MSALWSIYIGGMDDYHAAPSEAVARQMVERHNAAITQWYSTTPETTVARPPLESVLAEARPWPFDAEEHAMELAFFDYDSWGIKKGAA